MAQDIYLPGIGNWELANFCNLPSWNSIDNEMTIVAGLVPGDCEVPLLQILVGDKTRVSGGCGLWVFQRKRD